MRNPRVSGRAGTRPAVRGRYVLVIGPEGGGTFYPRAVRQAHLIPIVVQLKFSRRDREVAGARPIIACLKALDAATIISFLRPYRNAIAGVLAGSEFHVVTAARVAAELGLPGNPPETSIRHRRKDKMREALRAAGVPGPRFAVVEPRRSGSLGRARFEGWRFPLVAKRPDSASGIGVVSVARSGAIPRVVRSLAGRSLAERGSARSRAVVVEEFLPGDVYSVEGFCRRGRVHLLNITRHAAQESGRGFRCGGHQVAYPASPRLVGEVRRLARSSCRATGISNSTFHLELKGKPGRLAVLEIAGRLPGGYIPQLIKDAVGIDLPLIGVLLSAGQAIPRGLLNPKRARHTIAAAWIFSSGGRVRRILGLRRVRRDRTLEECRVFLRRGDRAPSGRFYFQNCGFVRLRVPLGGARAGRLLDRARALADSVRIVVS